MDEDEAIRFFAEIEGRPPRCHGTSLPAESSDENGKEEWFASDEFDPEDLEPYVNEGAALDDEVPDITLDGSGKAQTYRPRGKSSPTSRPGVFLGYHCEVGSEWKGGYIVADLEVFKQNINKPSVQQVKRIYLAPSEKYTFPLLPIYEKRTRSLCLDDPVMLDSDTRVDMVEHGDQGEVFDFNEGRATGTLEEPESKDAVGEVESSDGAEDEDPILESYLHPPTMEQRTFSARVYKLISNKQHKALTKLMFYARGAAASESGKLFETSTVELSENFRNANMTYVAEEAKVRMIGYDRVRTVRLTETIKNSIPLDPVPDWGLVAFLEKEIVYAIGSMREFDRDNFPKSFKPATPQKEATVLPTRERYGASAILPLRDFLECLDHARNRFRVMKNQETVELPNQYAAE